MPEDSFQEGGTIEVAVAYVGERGCFFKSLKLKAGVSIADLIQDCGVVEDFPEIDPDKAAVGIFGDEVTLDTRPRDGDRIEIYRPLRLSPADARIRRAKSR